MTFENSLGFARYMDEKDPLKHFRRNSLYRSFMERSAFISPAIRSGFNPKQHRITWWMNWKTGPTMVLEGMRMQPNPWVSYHEMSAPLLADIVGTEPEEVVAMNQLTVEPSSLMASFTGQQKNAIRSSEANHSFRSRAHWPHRRCCTDLILQQRS